MNYEIHQQLLSAFERSRASVTKISKISKIPSKTVKECLDGNLHGTHPEATYRKILETIRYLTNRYDRY